MAAAHLLAMSSSATSASGSGAFGTKSAGTFGDLGTSAASSAAFAAKSPVTFGDFGPAAAAAAAATERSRQYRRPRPTETAQSATNDSQGRGGHAGWDEVRFPASSMYFSPAPISSFRQQRQQQQQQQQLLKGLHARPLGKVAEEELDEEDGGDRSESDEEEEPFPEEVYFSHSAATASCMEGRRIVQWKSRRPLRFLRPRDPAEFEHGEALDNAVEEAASRNADGVLVQGGLKVRILQANDCLILLDNDKVTGKGQQSLSDMFLKMSLR